MVDVKCQTFVQKHLDTNKCMIYNENVRRSDGMKNYLKKNKGEIAFYLLTIVIALACTYRFRELNPVESYESVIISEQELAIINN